MTKKTEKPGGASAPERATRRGLGIPPELWRDARSTTGAFVRAWPELPEAQDDEELTNVAAATVNAPQDRAADLFDSQPRSRGPEYHPPSLPAVMRDRGGARTSASGTFRLEEAASVQVRPMAPPELSATAPPLQRPVLPPLERPRAPAREGSSGGAPPRVAVPARPRWANQRFLASAVVGLVFGSGLALGLVRVPVRAWGVLKTTGVPELLSAGIAGSVASVRVNAGDEVAPGDPVLQIHSADLQRNLEARRFELELLREELAAAAREEKATLGRSAVSLERRRQLLGQRLELKDAEAVHRKALLDDVTALVAQGSAPASELFEPRAAMQAVSEARLGIVDELAQLELEATDRRSEQQARDRARRSRLSEAEAHLSQAEDALGVVTVRAPARGWIESLQVTPGSIVQPGAELARLVPRSAPRSVVALVSVEDAAHVSVGEDASVEFSPQSQLEGTLAARIKHVSREVASANRVQAILGAPSDQGFVQLELELVDSSEYNALEPQLRTGAKALVNLVTPGRRLGHVLMDAVRSWVSFRVWS
jgi:multidrug resistance efflux pump